MRNCSKDSFSGTLWYRSARELPEQWDSSLPEGHFLRSDTQLAHEQAELQDFDIRFAAVRDGEEKIIMHASFAILHIRSSAVKDDGWAPLLRSVWRGFARIFRPKLVIGGHPYRHDVSSVYCSTTLSDWEAFGIYEQLLREAGRRAHGSAILVKDVDERFIPYFRNFGKAYVPMRNDISMEMDVSPEWQNVEDYTKSLKHKYAQRYRKVSNAMSGVTVRELDSAGTQRSAETLFRLYHGVATNQAVRLGYLSPQFLPALKSHYGDKLRIWLFEEAGVPVAFASAWVSSEVFDMFYIGFDYSRNAELQLYFNILFFAVEQSILSRSERLVLGRTALEAKARAGCTHRYLDTFIYIKNPLLRRWVQGQSSRRFQEEGAWEERHPFKTAKKAP